MDFPLQQVSERVKQVAALSAVVYFCGFLARRAQLQMLGVQATIPLVDQLYLEAGGKYLVFTGRECVLWLAVLLSCGFVASLALPRQRLTEWLGKRIGVRGHVAMAVLGLAVLGRISETRSSWAMAQRAGGEVWHDLATGGDRSYVHYTVLVLLVLLTSAVTLWVRARAAKFGSWRVGVTAFAYGILALQLVELPMAFGVLYQSASYPIVDLEPKSEVNADAGSLLLLETDKVLVLAEPSGSTLTLDRSGIHGIRMRASANLFALWKGHQ
jgi:hypothetical protein